MRLFCFLEYNEFMTYEYAGITFGAEPSRPAPSQSREPSPRVIKKLAEMLPEIEEIKSGEDLSPAVTDTEL